MKLGFVGTGTIAEAVIVGLRRKTADHEIIVSPRSARIAAALVGRFAGVRRAPSNAEVIAEADIVFLAMRPTQVGEALAGTAFRPGQIVVSFVAGLPIAELQGLAPGCRVGRMVPLPAIARGEGPVICYPAIPEISALLEGMGDVVLASSEDELRTLTSVSGFMSTYFELQLSLAAWLGSRGVEEDKARRYVSSLLAGLAQTALRTPPDQHANLPLEHQTKGGLNQRVRQYLLDQGWFQAPGRAFASILDLPRDQLK